MIIDRDKKIDVIMGQGAQLIAFYRQNPCVAVYDLLGVDLAPIQRVVFEDMWFKDYVIAVCGRGFGKSVCTSSIINEKNKGLVYLNEILPPIPSYLRDGEEEVIDWNINIHTSNGFKGTKRLCLEKGIEGKQLKTNNGFISKGSNHHPLLTLNKDGEFIYKKLEDFIPGDKVCLQRGNNSFGYTLVSLDDAYLIGLLIGDGCINKNSFSLTSEDEQILSFSSQYCIRNNIPYSVSYESGDCTLRIGFSNNNFSWFFDKYGIARVLSYNKSVPYSIRTSTRQSQVAFLQGYFDTDGTVDKRSGGVSCCSVSKKLLIEIQLMLLNFGIVARLRKKKTKSNFGKAYLLDMFSEDAFKFKELIGFRLTRKQKILNEYFESKKLNVNKDTIPYIKDICWDLRQILLLLNNKNCNNFPGKFLLFKKSNKKEVTYSTLSIFIHDIIKIISSSTYTINSYFIDKFNLLLDILKTNYFFDTVVYVDDWKGDCYDFEMDEVCSIEPNYFANGFINHNTYLQGLLSALSCLLYPGYRVGLIAPSFRQAKMMFSEIEKLYSKSSIFREACVGPPTHGADTHNLKFKAVGGKNGSFIEALPIGNDGSKIRGSRFYLVCVDELAQVPNKIVDMVLRPMGATKQDPMEQVRALERKKLLLEAGLAIDSDFEDELVNKMIMTSSGYYKFNHMYNRMRAYWKKMEECDLLSSKCPFVVHQIPYTLLPEGFLDKNNIEEAKRVMSNHEFRMEYEAAMVSDSDGFFKASLLESCTLGSNFYIELAGDREGQYIVGVDPNQAGSASCGVVIVKIGTVNRIVNVIELKKHTTQELTSAIQDVCDNYRVIRLFMDKGGGGKAVMDLLEEGYGGKTPIIDRTNDEHRNMQGRHILEMVNFNTSWITDANFATLSLLEDKKLLFPQPPVSTIDMEAIRYETVEDLKKQMLNIIVTPTSGGAMHFDTPKKGQNKDLYSALILAGYGIRLVEKEIEGDTDPVLHNVSGMVRSHHPGSSWTVLDKTGASHSSTKKGLSMAILSKKK